MSISIFKISKINFIRFKILLHLLHQLHRTQLRHRNLRRQLSIFAFLNCTWTAPTAPTAPNSTEIQKSSTSVEYFVFFELHQLHQTQLRYRNLRVWWNCTWTAPIRKSSVSVDDAWVFFNYYLWKCNIVKNCECTEYEFLRGLWESDIKNCNSGELHQCVILCQSKEIFGVR